MPNEVALVAKYSLPPANDAVIVIEVWTVIEGAVNMTETCPVEPVVPVDGLTLPAVALQVIVLPATGSPSEVRVAVSVLVSSLSMVKVNGEIVKVVADTPPSACVITSKVAL